VSLLRKWRRVADESTTDLKCMQIQVIVSNGVSSYLNAHGLPSVNDVEKRN
jgi:hypothetical protein